jgi:hypothetical protein
MNRISLLSIFAFMMLLGCETATSKEVWSCFQKSEINDDWVGISESKTVIRNGVFGETNSKVTIREISSKKESTLRSIVTFDLLKEGNSVQQTLLSADWEVTSDELNIFSDGRASKLLPSIGSILRGTQESLANGAVKTTYDSGLTTECRLIDESSN